MSNLLSTEKVVKYVLKLSSLSKETIQEGNSDAESESSVELTPLELSETSKIDNLPNSFNFFFDTFRNRILRVGTLHKYSDNKNITYCSFMCSVMFALDTSLIRMNKQSLISYFLNLKDKMLVDFEKEKLYEKFGFKKLGIKKEDIISNISNFKDEIPFMLFLSEYFSLNLYIVECAAEKIYIAYNEQKMNKYKNSVVILHMEEYWEPLLFEKNGIWKYNNPIIYGLIRNNLDKVQRVCLNVIGKPTMDIYVGEEDLSKYLSFKKDIKKEFTIEDPYDFSDDEDENIENDIKENGYDEITDIGSVQSEAEPNLTETEEKSTSKNLFDKTLKEIPTIKSKLDEIQNFAQTLNISLEDGTTKKGKKKLKTKNALLKEINKSVNN